MSEEEHVKRNTPFTPLWMLLAVSYGCMDLEAGTKNDVLQRTVSMWITVKVGIGDFLSCRPRLWVLREQLLAIHVCDCTWHM